MHTTKETALILGYSCDAVIRLMIYQGRLKATRFGKAWVISEKEIKRLLSWREKRKEKKAKLKKH